MSGMGGDPIGAQLHLIPLVVLETFTVVGENCVVGSMHEGPLGATVSRGIA